MLFRSFEECIHEYIFSGSLPENASTYVKRKADDELYEALQQGKFCYVLNSRQSGKSSLRLRTMSRLSETGVECASIDLSSINIQGATQENWYADLITKLIDSFVLDVDFENWWKKNQLNSPLMRFSNFLEKHLLVEIQEPVVIFIDEIDKIARPVRASGQNGIILLCHLLGNLGRAVADRHGNAAVIGDIGTGAVDHQPMMERHLPWL